VATGRNLVLYDGSCALCLRSRRVVRVFDWFQMFTWLNFRNPAIMEDVTCVTADALDTEMVVIDAGGGLHRGFGGWRAIAVRLPVSAWAAWLMYLPPLDWAGRKLYRWVAANRFSLAHCGDEGCRLPDAFSEPMPDGPWRETLSRANQRAQDHTRDATVSG
jgi:predicted DCC family thiol-disulfide oxidoreductase YuxK